MIRRRLEERDEETRTRCLVFEAVEGRILEKPIVVHPHTRNRTSVVDELKRDRGNSERESKAYCVGAMQVVHHREGSSERD